MSDILIRGMEMPIEQPVTLILDPSGRVWLPDIETGKEYMAKELQPHGDLIEAEPIKQFILDGLNRKEFGNDQIQVLTEVEYAPVVIPASK